MGNPYIEDYNKQFSHDPATNEQNNSNESTGISNELQAIIKIDMQSMLMKYHNVESLSTIINEIKKYLNIV